MKKATRKFIEERQKYCQSELSIVKVKQLGTGKANDCTNNALDASDIGDAVRTITGWLVFPYNSGTDSTDIVQHWWNKDSEGNYFDTTPDIESDCDYVIDMDLIHYYSQNYDAIENQVALSIILSGEIFFGADEDKSSPLGFKRIQISSLATNVLYRH